MLALQPLDSGTPFDLLWSKCFMKVKSVRYIVAIVLTIVPVLVIAQVPEYRITEDGQYQYLGNPDAKGNVFDETQGTYYRPITVRTFFLQAQDAGYIPDSIAYDEFIAMTLQEQHALLGPGERSLDCSIGMVIPEGCISYYRTYDLGYKSKGIAIRKLPVELNWEDGELAKIILHEW